jgi:hypothetical protein
VAGGRRGEAHGERRWSSIGGAMEHALIWGLGSFGACWLVHWGTWRIRVPEGYLVWLPAIFWFLPLTAVGLVWATGGRLPETVSGGLEWILAALLHLAVSACYICGYAGITEYSPSAEVLLTVRESMPDGVPMNALRVRSFTELGLTEQRIEDLQASGLIEVDGGRLRVTRLGKLALALSRAYRTFLGVEPTGRG